MKGKQIKPLECRGRQRGACRTLLTVFRRTSGSGQRSSVRGLKRCTCADKGDISAEPLKAVAENDLTLLAGVELGSIRERVDVGDRRSGAFVFRCDMSRRGKTADESLPRGSRSCCRGRPVRSVRTEVPWKKAENRLPERCWVSTGRAPKSDALYRDALYSDGDHSRGMLRMCESAQKRRMVVQYRGRYAGGRLKDKVLVLGP